MKRMRTHTILVSLLSLLCGPILRAQTISIGQMPRITIAHATGSNLMQFPVAVSMDYKETNNEIVRKIILGWANTDDTPTAPVNGEWKSSWDGGNTWSGTITNVPTLNPGTCIRLLNGNMISVPFDAPRSANPSSTVCNFSYITSTNNGGNWTAPTTGGTVTFPIAVYWMRFHRGMFQENDGTLYAPAYVAYANNGAATRSVLLKSTNNGVTWTQHSEITNPVTSGKEFDETAVSRCANGDWLAVLRQKFPTASDYQPLMYCRSTDKGLTWSAPAYLPGLGSAHTSGDDLNESVDPDLLLMPNGVLVLSYGRPNVHLAFSSDGNGTNWTNIQTTFTEVASSAGNETTGYTAVVPVSAHRFIEFGDTGANWSYPSGTTEPFNIWSRFIDVVRPQTSRIDLKKRLSYGNVTIMPATTLNFTDATHPESRLSAVFDGSVDYWSGALGTNSGVFQLDLQKSFTINAIGLALLRGQQQSANVAYSTDGVNWSSPVVSYTNATHYALNYTNVTPFNARYIRVNVSGSGQIGLAELELYEASSTFENSAASSSTAINGLLPAGYAPNGTSATQYGCSVQDGQGYQSNRALKLIDNADSYRSGIKRIVGASNTKTLEFMCRAAAVPAAGSFNIQLLGTVSGAESIVFYIAVSGDGKVKANNGSGWVQLGTTLFPVNTGNWRRVKVEANESANTASVYLDGVLLGTTGMYSNPANTTNLTGFGFGSNGTLTYGETVYFDDVNIYDPAAGGTSSGVNSVATQNVLAQTIEADKVQQAAFTLAAFPNPVAGAAQIRLDGVTAGTVQLTITSLTGAQVKKMDRRVQTGTTYINLPTQGLAPGVYIITGTQQSKRSQCKIVIP